MRRLLFGLMHIGETMSDLIIAHHVDDEAPDDVR